MTEDRGCTCTRARRAWPPDGACTTCGVRVTEGQIQDVVLVELCQDSAIILYRNNIGLSTHLPKDERRATPIKYGVGDPGGADLVGLYLDPMCAVGRFLAVETKAARGRQSPDQAAFQRDVEARGGVYAICRSAAEARELRERLLSGCIEEPRTPQLEDALQAVRGRKAVPPGPGPAPDDLPPRMEWVDDRSTHHEFVDGYNEAMDGYARPLAAQLRESLADIDRRQAARTKLAAILLPECASVSDIDLETALAGVLDRGGAR